MCGCRMRVQKLYDYKMRQRNGCLLMPMMSARPYCGFFLLANKRASLKTFINYRIRPRHTTHTHTHQAEPRHLEMTIAEPSLLSLQITWIWSWCGARLLHSSCALSMNGNESREFGIRFQFHGKTIGARFAVHGRLLSPRGYKCQQPLQRQLGSCGRWGGGS